MERIVSINYTCHFDVSFIIDSIDVLYVYLLYSSCLDVLSVYLLYSPCLLCI